MGRRSSTVGALGGVLCAVVLSGVFVPQGGTAGGYLSRTGPVPLRFGEESPPRAFPPPFLVPESPAPATAAKTSTTVNPVQGVATVTPPAPAVVTESASLPAARSNEVAPVASDSSAATLDNLYGGWKAENPHAIPAPLASGLRPEEEAVPATASELQVITPQMLVNYFRPARGLTNAVSMAVLVPVGFTPPSPPSGPGPSSQATYRTP